MNIIPEINEYWCELIKKYFNFTKEELLDSSNIEVCFNYYVWKYNPLDFRKSLQNLNILNPTIADIIYYNGISVDELFTKLCDLNDTELFYILQNFLVRFYSMIVYLTAKQIKIENVNEEYLDSWYLDQDFIFFVQFMVTHGYYDLSVKRLDFISDINRFFKIKNLDYINVSKVRGRDDVLMIIISKMFRAIFYKVLFEMNMRNKLEEANSASDTYEIIDELYDYFYRKIFMDMDNEDEGATDAVQPDDWEDN